MKNIRGRYWFFMLLFCMISVLQACGTDEEASALNDKAVSLLWNDLDAAQYYAQYACDVAGRHTQERAMALNTLADIAVLKMNYIQAWQLYSSVPEMTHNMIEVLASEIGRMSICQRTSDNVSFYEYRNSILLHLRDLHEDIDVLSNAQKARLYSLESSFRMESARYWFELEQLEWANREMAQFKAYNLLRDDSNQMLMLAYMQGLGIGLNVQDAEDVIGVRLKCIDDCLRNAIKCGNVRMESLSLSAICSLLLEYGTDEVLSRDHGNILGSLDVWDGRPEFLPTQIALAALKLSASYGAKYEVIECERLLASCFMERGFYGEALDVLSVTLDMLNDNYGLNSGQEDGYELLRPYRSDGVIVEEQWMEAMPHAVVPECLASIREQMSLAYSGMNQKRASDYNRTVYLELQKNIRLDRRYEARAILLEKSNAQLVWMLYAVAGAMAVLILLIVLFNKRINAANQRYAEMIRRSVELCESILRPAPAGVDTIEWLNSIVSKQLAELIGAEGVKILEDATIDVQWCRRYKNGDSRMVVNTVAPYLKAALRNAQELVGQEDRLKELEKQHYLYGLHANKNKRESLARKSCCQVVAECLPYIDRMRSEVRRMMAMPSDGEQYAQSLRYVGELAERINSYNELLSQWIRMRQGEVTLHVESFRVQELFDIIRHSCRSFVQKGLQLDVIETDAIVRADRVLTLFMLNTLADNARKFTPAGGTVRIEALQTQNYVELAVQDSGIGLTASELTLIRESNLFDPERIGLTSSKEKGSGFGILNCKGIIDKYCKSGDIFSVCGFDVESEVGKGSRFSFRLPKGIKRALSFCGLTLSILTVGATESSDVGDSLLITAYDYASRTYICNTEGEYEQAIVYADSAFDALNRDYLANGGSYDMLLTVMDTLMPSETYWLEDGFATDYETILWLRNEIAVSALATRKWDVYKYNDNAYLRLFKLYFGEWKIEADCRDLQRTNSNLYIAVVLFILFFITILIVRYIVHSRHWMRFRSDMKQAVRVVDSITRVTTVTNVDNFDTHDVIERLVNGIYSELEHLIGGMNGLMIALNNEGRVVVSSHIEEADYERLEIRVNACLSQGVEQSSPDGLYRAVPLLMTFNLQEQMIGVIGVSMTHEPDETWQVLNGMIARYLATTLYSCVIRFESGFRDIEQIQEESERIKYEDNRLHVSNLVLDNCLSALKHETVWYPSRIVQMVRELERISPEERSVTQVIDMQELVDYYREIFSILSKYALEQTASRLLHKERFATHHLTDYAIGYIGKVAAKHGYNGALTVNDVGMYVYGDKVLLEFLIESLLDKTMEQSEELSLTVLPYGKFVRFELHSKCVTPPSEVLDGLFSPLMNINDMKYVMCRQIIREHDEDFGHIGCRINAEAELNGMVIWFTVPSSVS